MGLNIVGSVSLVLGFFGIFLPCFRQHRLFFSPALVLCVVVQGSIVGYTNIKPFGPILDNWHQHRAVTSKIKVRGALCMVASFSFSIWIVSQVWLKVALMVMLMTLLTWFIRLPVIDHLADRQENH